MIYCVLSLHTDGQKMAKKLSIQISKETKCVKRLLTEYNACCQSFSEPETEQINFPQALDSSKVGETLQNYGVSCTIASGRRREIIDAYLALTRSKEDISMLIQEAENIVTYYQKRRKVIVKEIEHVSQHGLFQQGDHCDVCVVVLVHVSATPLFLTI